MRLAENHSRLQLDIYPQIFEVRTLFSDVNVFRHLNNIAIARFFEEGRAAVNVAVFGVDTVVRPSGGVQLLFASVLNEYLSPGEYPGMATVGTAVSRVGRSSFTQCGALFQDQRCVALCDAVVVYAVDGVPVDLPPSARASLEQFRLRP